MNPMKTAVQAVNEPSTGPLNLWPQLQHSLREEIRWLLAGLIELYMWKAHLPRAGSTYLWQQVADQRLHYIKLTFSYILNDSFSSFYVTEDFRSIFFKFVIPFLF